MKALHIAVFIFILNISLAAMNEVYGAGPTAVAKPVSARDIEEAVPPSPHDSSSWTSLMAASWLVVSLPVHVSKLLKIVWNTVMMGDLANQLIYSSTGYSLPSSLVAGLNALGVVLVLILVLSIVRGRLA